MDYALFDHEFKTAKESYEFYLFDWEKSVERIKQKLNDSTSLYLGVLEARPKILQERGRSSQSVVEAQAKALEDAAITIAFLKALSYEFCKEIKLLHQIIIGDDPVSPLPPKARHLKAVK